MENVNWLFVAVVFSFLMGVCIAHFIVKKQEKIWQEKTMKGRIL